MTRSAPLATLILFFTACQDVPLNWAEPDLIVSLGAGSSPLQMGVYGHMHHRRTTGTASYRPSFRAERRPVEQSSGRSSNTETYCYDGWSRSECEDYDEQDVNGASWTFLAGDDCGFGGTSSYTSSY